MARLTRNLLKALGIEDEEKQDEIIAAHRESVDPLKAERDKYKEEAEKLPRLQQEYDELKTQLDSAGDSPYKGKYEDIKKEYDDYKAGVEAKEAKAKKREAYKALLKEAKVSERRMESILKVSPIDDLEFDDKGEVKDREKVLEKIGKDWADFIVTDGKEGAQPPTPPAPQDGGNQPSRAKQVAAKFYSARYGAAQPDGGESK